MARRLGAPVASDDPHPPTYEWLAGTLDGWHRAYSTVAMEYKQFVVQAFEREPGKW